MLRRSFLSLMAGAALVAACGGGGDSPTGPESIVGTYTLRTINGQPPPQTVYQDADLRIEITGGRVTLNADGSFTDATDLRGTAGTTTVTDTETAVGTWTRSGDVITFTVSGEGFYTMTLSGRELTQELEGITLVYRR